MAFALNLREPSLPKEESLWTIERHNVRGRLLYLHFKGEPWLERWQVFFSLQNRVKRPAGL